VEHTRARVRAIHTAAELTVQRTTNVSWEIL
jgi:hypothetical protein